MNTTIVPMKLGDVFDRTFKLTARTIGRNAIIALIFIVPVSLLLAIGFEVFFSTLVEIVRQKGPWVSVQYDNELGEAAALRLLGSGFLLSMLSIVFGLAYLAAMMAITRVGCAEMVGTPVSWEEAIRGTIGMPFLRAIGQSILQGVAFVGIPIIPYAMFVAGLASQSVALSVIAAFLLIPAIGFVVFLAIRWAFVLPPLAWEDAGVIDSFRRSWVLVEGNWWRMLGILILFGIILDFAVSLIMTPLYVVTLWGVLTEYFQLLTSLGRHSPNPLPLLEAFGSSGIAVGILTGISTILTILVMPIYVLVLYFDLRARHGEFPSAEHPAANEPGTA